MNSKEQMKEKRREKARRVASMLTMVEHVVQRNLEKCYQIYFTI